MAVSTSAFVISQHFRLPGLGLLVLSDGTVPDWLATPSLHTALALRLHRPSLPSLALVATIEEVSHGRQLPRRALLLDADLDNDLPASAWLALESSSA